MKHALRISILMCGLVGTYVAAAVPQVPAPDGGPIFCAHLNNNYKANAALPPMMK